MQPPLTNDTQNKAAQAHASRKYPTLGRLLRSPQGAFGLAIATAVIVCAVLAPMLSPYDPFDQALALKARPPSGEHWLGTDQLGRDLLSRILFGARISLTTGLVSVSLGSALGTLVGLTAAYYGGWIEMALMAVIDVLLGFRTYLLAIMIMAILGTSQLNLMLAIGFATFPEITRLIRSEALSVRQRDFVEAARTLGAGNGRIMFRHVFPQVVAPLLVVATFNFGTAITVESALSFLGLGSPPPTPAWGLMISDGRKFILSAPWLPAIPGFAIMLTVLAFNLLGDTIRDLLDPRLRGR